MKNKLSERFMESSEKNNDSSTFLGNDLFVRLAVLGFGFITLLFIAKRLFGEEFNIVISWWLILAALGLSAMPLSMILFRRFRDSGWIFSKVIGIACGGWLMWFLSSVKIMKFSVSGCWFSIFLFFGGNVIIYVLYVRKHKLNDVFVLFENPKDTISHILLIELLFLLAFIIWNYIKAFSPEAYGNTEKMMDYGFMKAMYKSDYMPPEDSWMAGEVINYYYVGQFMATFLSKLSGVGVEYGYNMSLSMVAAFGFILPCAIVFNAASNFKSEKEKSINPEKKSTRKALFPYFAGGISGLAVSVAGNLHYNVYNDILPAFNKIKSLLGLGEAAAEAEERVQSYWFPDATRYIGYNPETNDKTIHEFPSYSFVIGDLHAHFINLIFVLTAVAVLYGFLQIKRTEKGRNLSREHGKSNNGKGVFGILFKDIFSPSVIMCGFFIGLFHTTNYWDFPIYFVVSGAVILFMNCRLYNFSFNTLKITLFHAVVVLGVSMLTALPFTLNFVQIANEINLCENHTPLYQLAVLWGLPVSVTVVFLLVLIFENKRQACKGVCGTDKAECSEDKNGYGKGEADFAEGEIGCGKSKSEYTEEDKENWKDSVAYADGEVECVNSEDRHGNETLRKKNVIFRFIEKLTISDLFILTMGLCAFGLVLIPEFVYVKDIYSGDYKRANTMFKLTYQAFIMFGMVMGYVILRFLFFSKKCGLKVFGALCLLLLIRSFGYFDNATKTRFGDYSFSTASGSVSKSVDVVLTIIYYFMLVCVCVTVFRLFEKTERTYKKKVVDAIVSISIMSAVMVLFGVFLSRGEGYQHLNAGIYLSDVDYDDYLATNWINENIEGRPVMLEANGNSYTYYNRVSTITGLPTILGWRTHEWLWRSTSNNSDPPQIVRDRDRVVEAIYTLDDAAAVSTLLRYYNVAYIYVGSCEREKFAENLNIPMLLSMGTVCYPENFDYLDTSGTFIIKVDF